MVDGVFVIRTSGVGVRVGNSSTGVGVTAVGGGIATSVGSCVTIIGAGAEVATTGDVGVGVPNATLLGNGVMYLGGLVIMEAAVGAGVAVYGLGVSV